MKITLRARLPWLLALTASTTAAASPAAEWGERFLHDGRELAAAPLHWHAAQWEQVAGLTAITGALMAGADREVADYHDRHRRGAVNNVMQDIGDVLSPPAVALYGAAAWGTGLALSNHELTRGGFGAAEAAVYATLASGVIKVAVGRSRPSSGAGPHDFSGGSWQDARQSFPSAHAAAAFAAARVLAPQLTAGERAGAYGAAALVSYSRVYQGDHWLSDVVFGAGLGYALGAALAHDAEAQPAQEGWWLMPASEGLRIGWWQSW